MEESLTAEQAIPGTTYGRVFRERGTLKIVIGAIVLAIAWYAYSTIHTNLLNQVKWPALSVEPAGLTVLGLRDVNRPGWQRKYIAIESNHAWQIRRPDDDEAVEESPDTKNNPEAADRGNDPGANKHIAKGGVVEVAEVMQTCPVFMVGRTFKSASMHQQYDAFRDAPYWDINLDLTDEGSSRYFQFSGPHEGERAVFVLKNEIATCAKINHMNVGSLKLGPIWVKEDAQKLIDFINGQTK